MVTVSEDTIAIEGLDSQAEADFRAAIGAVDASGVSSIVAAGIADEAATRAAADLALQSAVNAIESAGTGIPKFWLENDQWTAQPDPNFRTQVRWDYRCTGDKLNPGYPSIGQVAISLNYASGQNNTDVAHYYKTTASQIGWTMRAPGAGQRVQQSWHGDYQGCGDAIMVDCTMIVGGGVTAYGDEAQEWNRL